MLKIFIGLIFAFFDFNFNNFDLLADFVGYILIYLGLKEFPDIISFQKTKTFTIILLIESLAATVISIIAPENNNVSAIILAALIIPAAIVFVYNIYLLVKGIGELEQNTGLDLNYKKLFSLWRKHLILQILSAVFATILAVMALMFMNDASISSIDTDIFTVVSTTTSVLSAALVIALLVIDIIFVVYVFRAKTALDSYRPEEYVPDEFIPEQPQQTDDE